MRMKVLTMTAFAALLIGTPGITAPPSQEQVEQQLLRSQFIKQVLIPLAVQRAKEYAAKHPRADVARASADLLSWYIETLSADGVIDKHPIFEFCTENRVNRRYARAPGFARLAQLDMPGCPIFKREYEGDVQDFERDYRGS